MPRLLQNQLTSWRNHRHERAGTTGELRQLALESIRHANSQFLDFLCRQAGTSTAPFPFPEPLRMRLHQLTAAERDRLSRCGTLLVDIGLSDPSRWRPPGNELEALNLAIVRSNHWLAAPDAFVIAHTTVLVAWSVLHLTRAESGMLLGISAEAAETIIGLGVTGLSRVAQRHPEWVHLRWTHLPDVWSKLLDIAGQSELEKGNFTTLRCLQLSLGTLSCLERYSHGRARHL